MIISYEGPIIKNNVDYTRIDAIKVRWELIILAD